MYCYFCEQENRDTALYCNSCGQKLLHEQEQPIDIFVCYEKKDELFCEELEKHLAPLEQRGLIRVWNDRKITAGLNVEVESEKHLNNAQVILLLVSSDFLASNYCYTIQTKQAMKRYKSGKAFVIPILIRFALWQVASFGELQALPRNESPVSEWQDRDGAFVTIVKGIREIVEQLIPASQKVKEQWRKRGNAYFKAKRYSDALIVYEQALYVEADAAKWCNKGDALLMLERHEETSAAYAHAIHLDIDATLNHIITDGVLHFIEISHYEHLVEAAVQAVSQGIQPQLQKGGIIYLMLQAVRWGLLQNKELSFDILNKAILIKPDKALDYYAKAIAFLILERREEALAVFNQALQFPSQSLLEYFAQAVGLAILDRRAEAFDVIEETLRLRPTSFLPYIARIIELIILQDRDEALKVVDQTFGLRPGSSLPYLMKVVFFLSLNQEGDAMLALKEIPPTDSNFVLVSLLKYGIFNERSQHIQALEIIDSFIQHFPACAFAYIIKGDTLRQLRRYSAALLAYNIAIDLNPGFGLAYQCIGDIQKQRGNHKKAEQAYAKARELDRNL